MAERIEIIVTTDAADAAGTLDGLADQVEELTGTRPEISVIADTDDAADGLDGVAEGADALDGTAAAVEVSAPGAGDAIADIESVASAAEETAAATGGIGDAAITSAGSVKGATKDMLRPLGLAKSQVSDLTDTFQLLADTAVEKMELSEDQVGKLAGALPVIGVAIGLAVSAWSAYSDAQKKAAEEADKARDAFREVGDALATGDIEEAADRFASANEEIIASAEDLGIPYEDLADAITGVSGPSDEMMTKLRAGGDAGREVATGIAAARAEFATAADNAGALGDKGAAIEGAMGDAAEGMGGAAEAAADLAGYLAAVNAELDEAKGALDVAEAMDQLESAMTDAYIATGQFGANSEEASDANRELTGQALDAKQVVMDYAEEVGGIPEQTLTQIRSLIDQGKIAEAEALFNDVARPRDSDIYADPHTAAAEAALNHAARARTAHIGLQVVSDAGSRWIRGAGGLSAGGMAADTRAAGPAALAVAPQITIRVDARGAIDPYSVGRAVEQAAGAWGRVSGRWRPGLRSVS